MLLWYYECWWCDAEAGHSFHLRTQQRHHQEWGSGTVHKFLRMKYSNFSKFIIIIIKTLAYSNLIRQFIQPKCIFFSCSRTYGCYITHLKWPATVVCFKRGYGMCGASLLDHNQQVDSGRFFFSILSRCNNGRADAVRRTVCNKSRSTSAISPTAAPKMDDDWK